MTTIIIIVILYFLPSIVSLLNTKKDNLPSVMIVNLALWWTFIWWIIALVMAVWTDYEYLREKREYIYNDKKWEK